MGVTVGVEGAGEPLLLHFYYADGQVQVNAENPPGAPVEGGTAAPRHADVYIDLAEVVEEPAPSGEHRRATEDDQDRFGYAASDSYYPESDTAERQYGSFDAPPEPRDPGESPPAPPRGPGGARPAVGPPPRGPGVGPERGGGPRGPRGGARSPRRRGLRGPGGGPGRGAPPPPRRGSCPPRRSSRPRRSSSRRR